MPSNPYYPPTETTNATECRPHSSLPRKSAAGLNLILSALGVLIGALAAIPSDAPQFFLFLGIHFFTCGLLGVAALWCRAPIVLALTLRLASFIANATLASRIVALILYGTIRGPLVVAALLLVGIPISVNLVAAVVASSKKSSDDAV